MLEIGTGWGELAIRAARRGADASTRSPCRASSRRWPSERIAAAGLRRPGRRSSCCDYRAGRRATYDAVVSVEMIEAVGHEFWPTYFQTIDRVLAPGGRVAIQAITMPHDRMLATRNTYTWINKYIFPGGFLPSVEVIDEITRAAHRAADHRPAVVRARTTPRRCGCWDERVPRRRATQVRGARLRRDLLRMWHFYLEYSPGRLRLRLHRRPAAHLRPGGPDDHRPRSDAADDRDDRRASPQRLAAALRPFVGGDLPVRLRAWDGSEAGPGRRARWSCCARPTPLRRLLWHPGELGAAQAYVTGELDVPSGDLDAALDPRLVAVAPSAG